MLYDPNFELLSHHYSVVVPKSWIMIPLRLVVVVVVVDLVFFWRQNHRTSGERAIMASLAVTSSELDKTALWPRQSSTPSWSQLCGSGGRNEKKKR